MSDDGSIGSTGTEIYFEGDEPLFTNQSLDDRRVQLLLQSYHNPLSDRENQEYRRILRTVGQNQIRMRNLRAQQQQQQQQQQQPPQPQPQPTIRTYVRRLVNSLTGRNQNATIAPR